MQKTKTEGKKKQQQKIPPKTHISERKRPGTRQILSLWILLLIYLDQENVKLQKESHGTQMGDAGLHEILQEAARGQARMKSVQVWGRSGSETSLMSLQV